MKTPKQIKKTSQNFIPETVGTENQRPQNFKGELDLSVAVKDGFLDFDGESKAIFNLPRQTFGDVVDPQSMAAASLSGGRYSPQDKIPDTKEAASMNPSKFTPDMFEKRVDEVLANAYDPKTMEYIASVGGDVAKRWRDQKVYDMVRDNPALKEYFTEFFPDYKSKLDEDAIDSQVVMGVTPQGQPIRAGDPMRDPYTPNPAVVPRDILMPYDPERLNTLMLRKTAKERDHRTLYGAVEGFAANFVDWALSPKRRTIEVVGTYGTMFGMTPQDMGRQYNKMFSKGRANFIESLPVSPTGLLFKIFLGDNREKLLGEVPLLTDKQIEGLTYESFANLPGAKTATDKYINDIAEFLGPGSGLKVASPGMTPEASIQGPGAFRVGEGPSGTAETIGGMLIGMNIYRGIATQFNRSIIKGSYSILNSALGRNAPIDYAKALKDADNLSNKRHITGRFLQSLKRGQIYAAQYPMDLAATESALATVSVLSVERFTNSAAVQAYFKDNPAGLFSASMGVGFMSSVLLMSAVAGGDKNLINLAKYPIRTFADGFFITGYKDVAELLGDTKLNNKLGRKTVQQLGRQLQTLKQEDREAYDLLFDGFKQYRDQKDKIRTSLSDVLSTKDIDELLGYMDQSQSAGMTLALFDSARVAMQSKGQFGFGKVKRSTFGRLGMFRSQFEKDINNLAAIKNLEKKQIESVAAYGKILGKITEQHKKLGNDAPAILRQTVNDMSKEFQAMLNVPGEKAELFKNKLLQLYNLSDRYSQASSKLVKDTAIEETGAIWASMGEQDRAIFTAVVKEQMDSGKVFKGLTPVLNKLSDLQKVAKTDSEAMERLYKPLRDRGIFDEDNNLKVSPPPLSTMQGPQFALMSKVFNANKKTANDLYNTAYKDFTGEDGKELPAVDVGVLVKEVDTFVQEQSTKYGTDGFKTAVSVLTELEVNNPAARSLIKLLDEDRSNVKRREGMEDPPEERTYAANAGSQLSVDMKKFTVREAAQLRSKIGSRAHKLSNSNTSEGRKGAAVLMKIHKIVSKRIETSVGPTGNANLQKANDYYRDNVARLFFDGYVQKSLRSEINNPMPFRTAFNQTTNESNIDLDPAVQRIDRYPNDGYNRREIYEKMFPQGTDERVEADGLMRDLMLRTVFGSTGFKADRGTFMSRFRTIIDNESVPIFRQPENSGFADIFGVNDNYIINSNLAPDLEIIDGVDTFTSNSRYKMQSQANKSLVNDPFYSPTTMKANSEFVGDVFKQVVERAQENQRMGMSTTIGIFGKIAKEQNQEVIGNKLVEELFQFEGESSANQYKGLIDDVVKVYGSDSKEALQFESSLQQMIVQRMLDKAVLVKSIDRKTEKDPRTGMPTTEGRMPSEIEAIGAIELRMEFQKHTQLYQEVFGDADYDAINSLIKIASMSDNVTDILKFGGDLNQMSESAALSRFWGVARGVVSLRYVGSEWLLRKLASKNNETLVQVLATPGLGQLVMEMVEGGGYKAYKPNLEFQQKLVPSLVGALSDGSENGDAEAYAAITSLYNSSQENGEDFILNLVSLALAARNPEMIEELGKIRQSYAFDETNEMAAATGAKRPPPMEEQMLNLMSPTTRRLTEEANP